MFKKILYPTDFSEVAGKALGYVKQLRQAGAEEVVVIHVFDQRELRNAVALAGISGKWPIDLDRETREREGEHMKHVQQMVENLKGMGFRAKGIVREGIPLREILKTAEDEQVSVIVLGSTGKSNLEEVMLGSVSEGINKQSRQPVLVIKRDSR
jgi:nucleotide-binding universal stress UspA family protein